MRRRRLLLALLVFGLGCATRPYGSLSLVSTQPQAVKATILARDVKGSDCRSGIFVLGDKLADYGVAVQEAIASVPGADTLLDASVDFEVHNYVVYQKWCLRVSGTAAVLE